MNGTVSVGEIILSFVPSVRVPPSSIPSIAFGCILLSVAIYTLTIPGITPLYRTSLCLLAAFFFYDFGYGPHVSPGRTVDTGLAVVGLFGLMRLVDIGIVSFLDAHPPRWVVKGTVQPLPTTKMDRLLYAVDQLLSMRGLSLFADTHWDFASKRLLVTAKPMSRAEFLRKQLISVILQYFVLDVLDSLNKSRKWDTTQMYPITSLPLLQQLPFAISVCAGTGLSITIPFALHSIIAVLFGSLPESWPPMMNAPFSATSLTDFWTHRWHSLFRHTFDRLASLAIFIIPLRVPLGAQKAIRATIIFGLSATLHLCLLHRLEISATHVHPAFFDRSTLLFFLSQPFAVFTELVLIKPISQFLFPQSLNAQNTITRIWAWSWLLFSGRWWSDVWVRRGLWDAREKVVGLSVIRGLWKGKWVVQG